MHLLTLVCTGALLVCLGLHLVNLSHIKPLLCKGDLREGHLTCTSSILELNNTKNAKDFSLSLQIIFSVSTLAFKDQ